MAESSKTPYLLIAVLVLAVLGVYLPGLRNELLFDDMRLSDGTIFGQYGSLMDLRPRTLSYGSFVWLQKLLGDGWWKQRLFNVGLHLGVCAAVYALLKALLAHTRFPQDIEEQAHFTRSRDAALCIGVGLFALNPAAVYAVGYLVQRSIVMATLFAVLACWAFVRGLQTGRAAWHAGALACYALAVLSKEHAVMTAAMALPLYIYLRRPGWKTIAMVATAALLLVAVAAAVLHGIYGDVLGRVFDPRSAALAQQLEALRPGVAARMYPLSILNEAALFFAYGLLWVFPYVGWMSVDLRPPFPLGFASPWHLAGALGYLALLAGAAWMLLRRTGVLGLAALCLLFPLLWYWTEFATVWVQDPFVLYRSYLWAVALPGLLAIVLTGFHPRTLYIVGAVAGLVLGGMALERVASLRDDGTVWSDAAEKINRDAPPNAVGRSRPFLNLGAYHLERGALDQATREFIIADALGDLGGNARFNAGVALQQQKQHEAALQSFAAAQTKGFSGPLLHYHRAESEFALGRYEAAFNGFDTALREPGEDSESIRRMQLTLRQRHADAALATGRLDTAVSDFRALLKISPQNARVQVGLGIALASQGKTTEALAIFNPLIARSPSAPAFYGRAVAYHHAGRAPEALKDLDQAIRLEPGNAQYRAVREQFAASAGKP
ncbi:tetratricopeptide repeat protein [Acidovorax sp. NCPPB 2350]|nr:tetratricopeptide repeat protein [Acidovorax sp. NCPPB 2350]